MISLLIGIITVHCIIRRRSEYIGFSQTDLCRSCLDEEEIETIEHLICYCLALQERRLNHLGKRSFQNLDDLRNVSLGNLLGFIQSTQWFNRNRVIEAPTRDNQ